MKIAFLKQLTPKTQVNTFGATNGNPAYFSGWQLYPGNPASCCLVSKRQAPAASQFLTDP